MVPGNWSDTLKKTILLQDKVRPLYRGMGTGKELTRKIIEKSKGEGAKELCLLVRENSYRVINLYHKLGFKPKTVPALEEKLERERLSLGRRRIVLSKNLVN